MGILPGANGVWGLDESGRHIARRFFVQSWRTQSRPVLLDLEALRTARAGHWAALVTVSEYLMQGRASGRKPGGNAGV
ncbi:hypothetical protein CCU68_00825 [Pseudomonas gingeri NCPPB 3146 = LMG 5327]|uniref:Uncharacterized protein n=1 Tax=Pseudomonas gingeri NCPPB 3146 = LMG 5327 TaxID=707248 RepID=A0ABX4YC37_9PSED|nr:hypothetical protein CCU68_00825 [Pseudomonas gingeri NCPPB 3146 = LMG 5327]